MKLFTRLIPALLLATSSVALADPSVAFKVDGDAAFRDHRFRQPRWTELSKMLDGGGRSSIKLTEAKDDLTAIRLQSGMGATYVYSIILTFDNGQRETIQVGKWIYARSPLLTFDIPQNKGGVDRITVRSWASTKSTFQVLGQETRHTRPMPPTWEPPAPPQPVSVVLGTGLSFSSAGYLHLPVGIEKGAFSKIRIVNNGFGTYLGSVNVMLASGGHQTIEVGKTLGRGETLDLDIAGRAPQSLTAVTLMQADVRAYAPSGGKLDVILL
jgi:hypothetical protein